MHAIMIVNNAISGPHYLNHLYYVTAIFVLNVVLLFFSKSVARF